MSLFNYSIDIIASSPTLIKGFVLFALLYGGLAVIRDGVSLAAKLRFKSFINWTEFLAAGVVVGAAIVGWFVVIAGWV